MGLNQDKTGLPPCSIFSEVRESTSRDFLLLIKYGESCFCLWTDAAAQQAGDTCAWGLGTPTQPPLADLLPLKEQLVGTLEKAGPTSELTERGHRIHGGQARLQKLVPHIALMETRWMLLGTDPGSPDSGADGAPQRGAAPAVYRQVCVSESLLCAMEFFFFNFYKKIIICLEWHKYFLIQSQQNTLSR